MLGHFILSSKADTCTDGSTGPIPEDRLWTELSSESRTWQEHDFQCRPHFPINHHFYSDSDTKRIYVLPLARRFVITTPFCGTRDTQFLGHMLLSLI